MKKTAAVFLLAMILAIMYFITYTRNTESYDQEAPKLKIADYITHKNNPPKEVKFDPSDAKKYEKLIRPYTIAHDKNCVLTIPDNFIGFGDLPLRIPDRKELESLSVDVITCLYHRYVTTIQIFCGLKDRAGEVKRNGWYVCGDPAYSPKQNCTVFLSNKAFPEQTFSDDMKSRYKCRVYNTPLSSNHTLQSWIEQTNNTQGTVDVLTLSINSTSELKIIDKMVRDDSIKKVRQLLLELHFDPKTTDAEVYILLLERLRMLYSIGLRITWFDQLIHCATNKFNKCYAVYFIQPDLRDKSKGVAKVDLPSIDNIRKLNGNQIADLYFSYIETTQFFCQHILRIGRITDGGWNVCHDQMLKMKSPCIVYSFGVFNDLSFDDEVAATYNCKVYAFDPTTPFDTHQHGPRVWFSRIGLGDSYRKFQAGYVAPLTQIRAKLNHQSEPIAILKADIEGAEWSSVPNMINMHQLEDVSQLYLEFHGDGNTANQLILLKMIHDAGFRIFWYHINPACTFNKSLLRRSRCQEVYFMNTKFKAKNS